jgi:O-antigen/teichoic acid export membrane protein
MRTANVLRHAGSWRDLAHRAAPVARPVISSLTGAFAGQAALLVSGVLAARVLGPENRGHLALLTLIPVVICQIGMLGVEKSVTYHIAREDSAALSIVARARRIGLLQAIICSLVNGIVLWALMGDEKRDVQLSAALTLIVPLTIIIRNYALAILQGMRQFRAFNFQRNVQPFMYAFGLVALFAVHEESLAVVSGVWTMTSIVATVMGLVSIRLALADAPEEATPAPSSGEMVRFGAKGFLGSASPLDTFRLDQAVVGLFLSPVALGIYVTSVAFTNLPRFVAQSIGIVAFPQVARQQDDDSAKRWMWRFFWLSMAITLATVIPLIVLAPELVPLAFGDDFRDAVVPMQILLVGSVIFGARRVLSDGMRGRGMPSPTTWAEVASWFCLVPALAILVRWNELEGVALAIVLSAAFGLAALLFFLWRASTAVQPTAYPIAQVTSSAPRRRRLVLPHLEWQRRYLLALIWLGVAGFAGLFITGIAPSTDAVLLTALGLVLFLPIIVRIARREFDIFEPIVLYTIAYAVMFLVRPIAMIVENDFLYVRPSRTLDAHQGFTEMLVMALIGAVAFFIGYHSKFGPGFARRLKPPPENYHLDTVVSGAIAMSLLGIAFFGAYLLKTGRWGSPQSLLQGREAATDIGSGNSYIFVGQFLLIPASLLLIALGRSRRNPLFVLLASVSIAIILLRALPTGSRTTLLPFVGGLFVYHYISRNTRPGRGTVVLITFLVLIGSALLAETRTNSTRQEQTVSQVVVENLTNPLDALGRLTSSGGDASMAPGVAALVPLIPETIPYEYGMATIGDLVVRPVPRAIWPEKPVTFRERISKVVWPEEYASNIIRLEVSIIFSFYLDWGMFGVAFGMAIVGILARALYVYFLRNSGNLVAQLIYATSLTYMVSGMRDSPAGTIVHMCFTVLPVWLLFHISASQRSPALQLQRQTT